MNIIGKLLGSSEIIDAGIKSIDAVCYTEEERADQKLKLLKAYEPFKVAQRLIAMTFCVPYALAWIVTFFVSFTSIELTVQSDLLSGKMGIIVAVIVTFYYGGGTINGIRSK